MRLGAPWSLVLLALSPAVARAEAPPTPQPEASEPWVEQGEQDDGEQDQAAPPADAAAPGQPAEPALGPAPPPPQGAPPPPYPYPPYPYPYAYPPPGPYPQQPYRAPPPLVLPYQEGDPVPEGYRVESRVRRGPIIAGTIMAGTTYLINLFVYSVASSIGRGDSGFLLVPGVGTWGYVGEACDHSGDGCEIVVLHSLTHSAGVALIVYGLAARKQQLVRSSVRVVPGASRSAAGVSVAADF